MTADRQQGEQACIINLIYGYETSFFIWRWILFSLWSRRETPSIFRPSALRYIRQSLRFASLRPRFEQSKEKANFILPIPFFIDISDAVKLAPL